MPKFVIKFVMRSSEIRTGCTTVEAENADEACKKAESKYYQGNVPTSFEYNEFEKLLPEFTEIYRA
jgi:hypothetical protein